MGAGSSAADGNGLSGVIRAHAPRPPNPLQRLQVLHRGPHHRGPVAPSGQPIAPLQGAFWIELAQTLERGKFDSLFVADALGVLDVYRGSPEQTLRAVL